MNLLLDENLSPSHSAWLRSHGYDARSVRELDLAGASDARLWIEATQKQSTIVTLDSDFANLLRFPLKDSPGVIWLKLSQPTEAAIRSALNRVLDNLPVTGFAGRLFIVEEHLIRIRTAS